MRRFLSFITLCCIYLSVWAQDSAGLGVKFKEYGLVNIKDVAPEIEVFLPYSTEDNFTGNNLYGELSEAYMVADVAQRLSAVQKELSERRPGYRLLVLDAARPLSVQKYMYTLVQDTPLSIYVANPAKGGMHNFGVAVDLTIIDASGRRLDMGTPFDHFGDEAHVGNEAALVAAGRISPEARVNRRLLIDIMSKYGFKVYSKEWWHFDSFTPDYVRSNYKLLDF